MKPVYFPFTHLPRAVAERFAVCFPATVVYQPSAAAIPGDLAELAARGLVEIRTPIEGEEERLLRVCSAFTQWARTHRGSDLSVFKTGMDRTPLWEETFPTQIRSAVRKGMAGAGQESSPEQEAGFNARMFLSFAQTFDRQNWELDQDLRSMERMERRLLNSLHGEADAGRMAQGRTVVPEDLGAYMTAGRLASWTRLMAEDDPSPALFLTHSPFVFETLTDGFSDYRPVATAGNLPATDPGTPEWEAWRGDLDRHLTQWWEEGAAADPLPPPPDTAAAEAGTGAGRAFLRILMAPKPPEVLFAEAMGEGGAVIRRPGKTFVALLGSEG